MSGGRVQWRFSILAFLVSLLLDPCLLGQTHHRVKKQEAAIPAPVAPPAPLTPAQMPASPPSVAFAGGQLTINAPNSTLGDILREVRKQTGASVDIPGNATERVMGVFGPGPARDVLAALLNGSHFNYVLLGSETDPSALDRVILISKTVTDQNPLQANNARPEPAGAQPTPPQAESMDNSGEETLDGQEAVDIFGGADDQSNQMQQADDQQQQGQPNPFGSPANPAVKTPQQLLQELQQQQQQQGVTTPGEMPNPGGPRLGLPGMPPTPVPH